MLAVAAAVGRPLLGAGVAAVQVVFTLGGVRSAPMPAARAGAWLALIVAVGASVWMVAADADGLWPMAVFLAPAFVAAVTIQLARRDGRQAMTMSLTVTVAACALALLPVAWLALRAAGDGIHAVWLGLLGVAVVGLTELVPVPVVPRRLVAIVLAGAIAAGLALVASGMAAALSTTGAVVVAASAALSAVIAFAAVDRITAETAENTTGALTPLRMTLPVVVAAPVSYVLGRVVLG
jgi:hypothetical protein